MTVLRPIESIEDSDPPSMHRAHERFLAATPRSRAIWARSKRVFPGGTTSSVEVVEHYPVYVDRAEQGYLYDVDGRRIIDLLNAANSLVFGHGFEGTTSAIREQVLRGVSFGPHRIGTESIEYAELLRKRIPSIEQVRYTCSGTEATMLAMRLARAYTTREKVILMEGSYHGLHDGVALVWDPTALTTGDRVGRPAAGVIPAMQDALLFARYNNLDSCQRLLEQHRGRVAAVMLEPFLGAGPNIEPAPGYLTGLRELCDDHGAILIFDEMIAMGLGPGGAQGLFDVVPDLTVAGKSITGGVPLAVIGGPARIMGLCARPPGGSAPVVHSSTYAGNPVAIAAGLATLKALTPDVYACVAAKGADLRTRMRQVIGEAGAPIVVTGTHQLVGFHVADGPVTEWRETLQKPAAKARISFSLMSQNVYTLPGRASVSMATTDEDIDQFLEAFSCSLHESGVAA